MSDLKTKGTKAVLSDPNTSAFAKYRKIAIGDAGFGYLILYELMSLFVLPMPGALGLLMRQKLMPLLLGSCGRGVVFGRNIAIRNPRRIHIGDRVILEEGCTLDAKGSGGEGIRIGAGTFIGKGTILSMADGTIDIDEDCNIGSNCRLGTLGELRLGKKVLIAAYTYIVGATHESSRTDIPIMDQPNVTEGPIVIGDGAWLGSHVTVLDGQSVGEETIVGAHAVVTRTLPAWSIAVGMPAKVVKDRRAEAQASS